jgi:hypothetical protein
VRGSAARRSTASGTSRVSPAPLSKSRQHPTSHFIASASQRARCDDERLIRSGRVARAARRRRTALDGQRDVAHRPQHHERSLQRTAHEPRRLWTVCAFKEARTICGDTGQSTFFFLRPSPDKRRDNLWRHRTEHFLCFAPPQITSCSFPTGSTYQAWGRTVTRDKDPNAAHTA